MRVVHGKLQLANQARFGPIVFLVHSGEHLDQFLVPSICLPALLKSLVPPFDGGDVLWLTKLAQGHSLIPGEGFPRIVTDLLVFHRLLELVGVRFEQANPFDRALKKSEEAA
jgi:hypothetical protein